MQAFQDYNASLVEKDFGKTQYGFQLTERQKRENFNKEFYAAMQKAISHLYYHLKQGAMKAAPLPEHEFDIPNNVDAQYTVQVVLGFPFRLGVIDYQIDSTLFFKVGIKTIQYERYS